MIDVGIYAVGEDGTAYEGEYLFASDTIDYMGAVVALLSD